MPAAVHLQLRIVGNDGTVFTDKEILCLGKSSERLEAFGEPRRICRRLVALSHAAMAAPSVWV